MVGGPATSDYLDRDALHQQFNVADFNGTPIATTFVSTPPDGRHSGLECRWPRLGPIRSPSSRLAPAVVRRRRWASPGSTTRASILTSITPTSATVGDPATPITLTGTGFISSSTADFNGTPIATIFVSATQLTAVIPVSDLAAARTDSVNAFRHAPDPAAARQRPQTFIGQFRDLADLRWQRIVEPGPGRYGQPLSSRSRGNWQHGLASHRRLYHR